MRCRRARAEKASDVEPGVTAPRHDDVCSALPRAGAERCEPEPRRTTQGWDVPPVSWGSSLSNLPAKSTRPSASARSASRSMYICVCSAPVHRHTRARACARSLTTWEPMLLPHYHASQAVVAGDGLQTMGHMARHNNCLRHKFHRRALGNKVCSRELQSAAALTSRESTLFTSYISREHSTGICEKLPARVTISSLRFIGILQAFVTTPRNKCLPLSVHAVLSSSSPRFLPLSRRSC